MGLTPWASPLSRRHAASRRSCLGPLGIRNLRVEQRLAALAAHPRQPDLIAFATAACVAPGRPSCFRWLADASWERNFEVSVISSGCKSSSALKPSGCGGQPGKGAGFGQALFFRERPGNVHRSRFGRSELSGPGLLPAD